MPHVLPRVSDVSGTILVAACGAGTLLRHVVDAAASASRVMAVDSDPRRVDASRAAVVGTARPVFFATNALTGLGYAPDVFGAAIGVHACTTEAEALNAFVALDKVVRPGGVVTVCALGARSAGLLLEAVLEECLARGVLEQCRSAIDDLSGRRVDLEMLDAAAERVGLQRTYAARAEVDARLDSVDALRTDPLLGPVVAGWAELDAVAPGVVDAALARLATYFGGDAVDLSLELLVWAGTVREPDVMAVDEVDFVDEQ